jgi:hypothetical protein
MVGCNDPELDMNFLLQATHTIPDAHGQAIARHAPRVLDLTELRSAAGGTGISSGVGEDPVTIRTRGPMSNADPLS